MVGEGPATLELRESPGFNRRQADLLAEVPDPQVQAKAHAADSGGHSVKEDSEGRGTVGREDCAETGE